MNTDKAARVLPFSLTLAVIALDQLTKLIVSLTVKPWTVGFTVFNDLFRIVRVYNPGIAFSIGGSLSSSIRSVLFGLLPLIIILVVVAVYFRSDDLNRTQRWCVAGIIGGGLGNLIDRFFRPNGVLDFIDVRFFGIFGLDRWPTFNVADSAVVVCGILLMVSLILGIKNAKGGSDE
jgi:signal peptidase II